jgi:hypothetical protein
MLGADVLVFEPVGLFAGRVQHLAKPRIALQISPADLGQPVQLRLHDPPQMVEPHAGLLQQGNDHPAVGLAEQRFQQMQRRISAMPRRGRQLLPAIERLARLDGELMVHCDYLLSHKPCEQKTLSESGKGQSPCHRLFLFKLFTRNSL